MSTKLDLSFGMEMHGQWGKKTYIFISDHFLLTVNRFLGKS